MTETGAPEPRAADGTVNMKFIGIVLTALGILVVVFNGINDHANRAIIEQGSMNYSDVERRGIPIPADVGLVAVIGGIAALLAGNRRRY